MRVPVTGAEPGDLVVINLIVAAITFAFCAVMAIAALRVVKWWERHNLGDSVPSKAPLDTSSGDSAGLANKETPRPNRSRDLRTD